MRKINVIGVDPGFAAMGIAHLRATLLDSGNVELNAVAGWLVQTTKDRGRGAWRDEDRRMGELMSGITSAIKAAAPVTLLAYEVYRPFKSNDDDHRDRRSASGRLVSQSIGLVYAAARAAGIETLPLDPKAPKKALRAANKPHVRKILSARLTGYGAMSAAVGPDPDYHVSDAFGLAYAGFVKTMEAQR